MLKVVKHFLVFVLLVECMLVFGGVVLGVCCVDVHGMVFVWFCGGEGSDALAHCYVGADLVLVEICFVSFVNWIMG